MPQFAARSLSAASDASRGGLGEQGGGSSDSAFSWKGWTNGGGDRASTAAQFSRLADQPAMAAIANPGMGTLSPGRAVAAATVPAVHVPATAVPAHEQAMLAPIHAAIERMLARTQDELAVTVRFEQGGSLSLKLTMRDGTIGTHIQTDLPGLESALREAWTSFAQDWNQRGVKLGTPSFGGSTATGQDGSGREGQRAPGRDAQEFEQPAAPFGSAFARHAGRGTGRSVTQVAAREIPHLGLGAHGLRTWA